MGGTTAVQGHCTEAKRVELISGVNAKVLGGSNVGWHLVEACDQPVMTGGATWQFRILSERLKNSINSERLSAKVLA